MSKLQELRQSLASAQGKATALLDKVEADGNRDFTAEEEASFDALTGEMDRIKADITKQEKADDRRRAIGAIAPSPALANQVLDTNPAMTGGFAGIGEFVSAVRAVHSGAFDERLLAAPSNPHQGGSSGGEGFLVPPQFSEDIFTVMQEFDEFGPLVDEEPTTKREIKSFADETTPWSTSGVTANWRSEGSQMTEKRLTMEPRSLPLNELYVFVTATAELLEDAPRLNNLITNKSGQAFAWKKNTSMVNADGVGKPLGWMNSAALVSVAKEAGQTADTITPANVLSMFSRLLVVPGDRPFWLANRDTVPALATMKIGDTPVWTGRDGLVDAPHGLILGYPVRFSEHAKTLGDKGDLQLISPKGYHAARRESGPQFAQSMHLYFDYNVEAFRWTFRFGGQPHLSAPVSPANGSKTKSHFVTLDERA
ncbi:MAG: phage major capsid protein [Pikeienuella sp.]